MIPVRLPRVAIGMLGACSVVSYGACFYAFGVLISPISDDTGWSVAALGSLYGGIVLISSFGGTLGGRLLDRSGPRPVMLLAGTVGAGLMALASWQHSFAGFALTYVLGCGIVGALAFYQVLLAIAARVAPGAPARAIAALTVIGAFASPVYLPLTAVSVNHVGWRDTVRIQSVTVALVMLTAAAVLGHRSIAPVHHVEWSPVRHALRRLWHSPAMRIWLLASLVSGAAQDTLLAYQVPIMVAAGLPLAAASLAAGIRGFAQLGGRLPLGWLVARRGARWSIVLAYAVAAGGALLLLVSGSFPIAVVYALLAGVSLGMTSPLQGIYTHELNGEGDLGMVMGVQQAFYGIGGAAGPVAAGLLLGLTGGYTAAILAIAVGMAATAIMLVERRAMPCAPAPARPTSPRS